MKGGKKENKIKNKYVEVITDNRHTRRVKNNKQNKNTKKNKKQEIRSEMDNFRARMNMPIGTSSFGIPLTPEMIADRERMAGQYHV